MDAFYRKNEGMLLICQNNKAKSITIQAVNGVMEQLLGYTEEELRNRPFETILTPKVEETLQEYIEFEEGGQDVHAVLSKVSEIGFVRKNQQPVQTGCKIVRAEAKDRNHWFRLIAEDSQQKKEAKALRQQVVDNFKGHEVLDAETGLPDAATLEKDVELAQFYAGSKGLQSCLAYLRVDDFAAIGEQYDYMTAVRALFHVSRILRRNLRAEDMIGRVDRAALGVILLDLSVESARVVLNRLRWSISADPYETPDGVKHALTVSVCLVKLEEGMGSGIANRASASLAASPEPNAFLELYKS